MLGVMSWLGLYLRDARVRDSFRSAQAIDDPMFSAKVKWPNSPLLVAE